MIYKRDGHTAHTCREMHMGFSLNPMHMAPLVERCTYCTGGEVKSVGDIYTREMHVHTLKRYTRTKPLQCRYGRRPCTWGPLCCSGFQRYLPLFPASNTSGPRGPPSRASRY